jgi:flagellar motility protein MotE (MotC chaperone)
MTWWRLTSVFVVLSCVLAGWLIFELAGFNNSDVMASDKKEAEAPADPVQRSLQEKNDLLNRREAEVAKRELAVTEKEKVLDNQIGRYERVIHDLKAQLADSERMQDNRADSIRRMYEKMEPKKAAQILEQMDLGIAASIVGGMKQDKAAEVMDHMSKERARSITEKYLSRLKVSSKVKVNEGSGASSEASSTNEKGGEP